MTHTTDAGSSLTSADTENTYRVSRSKLPLSCPTTVQKLWNPLPRVHLPIEKTGEAICPCCSARYELVD